MDELLVKVEQKPGEIKSNLDDLAAALTNQMQAYEGLEVTEDNIPERKNDLATLRKMSKAIDDRRKEVKKSWDAPLKEFEAKVKDVAGIIDKQIIRIDGDIKEFDRKRVAEKQEKIKALYEEEIGEYADYLPLSVIKSSKWDNKTCGETEIRSDLQEMVLKVKSDLSAIKALNSEFEEKLLNAYKTSGNQLSVAIQKHTDYTEAKIATEKALKEAQERKEREEAERRAREEEQRKIASEKAWDDQEQIPVVDTNTGAVVGSVSSDLEPVVTFRVKGTDNIDAVRTFMSMSEIEFEEV
jgi:hypothetical protein